MDADYLKDVADLVLRFLPVVAGIAWIGASFYFIRLDLGLRPPEDEADPARGVGGEYWGVHGGGFYHSQKYLVADAACRVRLVLRRPQAEVEPDEVEGGADPGDPRHHVEQAQDEIGDVPQVDRVHRSFAIATSSKTPVSSSSSRVRASRRRSTSRISAFGRPFTKTTKRKPNFSS